MAAAVDLGYLSNHLSLPQDTLATVASTPTADLVNAVLAAVAAKAREYDELYSEKLNVDIALENAVRSAESRCDGFKATADKALKELEELRRRLQEEETARQTVENQLQTLKSESTTSNSQVETLRARITSLEASKRDTLAILDTKNAANVELSDELQKQHQKNLALSQELSAAQQEVQASKTAANSVKFREQSLRQELDLTQKNNEWLNTELQTKSAEALKYRKEKGQRITELQRLLDEASSTNTSLTKSEALLRSRLEALQKKNEEILTKLQQVQESAARSEAGYRQEVDTAKRLAQVSQEYAEQYKKEITQLKTQVEQLKDNHAEELRKVLQQLEQTKEECSRLESREQELLAELDQVRAVLSTRGRDTSPGGVPHTPRPNGSHLNPGTPFGTPGSIRAKSSFVAYEEIAKCKADLAGEKRRNRELSQQLDEVMTALEAKQPELEELHEEAARLREENVQMSQIAEDSFKERDQAKKVARKAESAFSNSQVQARLLQAQMRDLSIQIQVLLFNMHAREKGLDQLTEEEAQQYHKLQRGEVSDNALNDMSDTHMFITEKFVAFKDIVELQEKNQELLRVTRELADKFENEEAVAARQQAAEDQEEVVKLRELVSKLRDESQSLTARMKSYMTERDMFRRLLQQKATAGEINSVLGNSVDGREVLASIEQNNHDEHDLNAALRELQANFDTYRNEQSVDLQTVREQARHLAEEKSSLQSEVAKLSSQLNLINERYEMLQEVNKDLENQKDHIKKRNSELSQHVAKTEGLAQSRAEDLIEIKGLLESMRSENSNLKAEKALWKSIQDRLIKDNEELGEEKTRLNNLLASQQSLQNERQLSESETKRRMQNQIDNLETELSSTKRKLADEVEEAKKLQLRKDFDSQQAQKRIDDLTAAITMTKEELVATKTSRDHLQARVDELTVELRTAEERAQRLQPQPTSRTAPANEDGDDLEGRIQELTDDVADLRRELDIANTRLETARSEAEHFKELARTFEEDLRSMESSQETYREEMDAVLAAKDTKIKELEQRAAEISTELANSNTELSSLRDSQGEITRRFEDEKRILDSEISRLQEQEARYKETAKHHQANLRAQAEIASKAQDDYEQELVKHAEAAKQVQTLRTEYNKLKSQAATWRSEAETAKATLAQSQDSWEERRKQLEQELSELKTRRDDASAQNKLLHAQLENVTTQISDLQQSRSFGDDSAATAPVFADTAVEGLRELNSFLRREKEILECQYELKLQESKRLQQQVNHMQSELDETRLKLEQERRSQAESLNNSRSHTELMDKVNELNVVRESNATLRNEVKQLQRQLEQKKTKVQELETRLQPLQARVGELESQEVFLQEEIKQLQEDRDRWQKRTESILTKYGRVDPAELEQLKQSVTELEAQRDALKQSEEPLKVQIAELQVTMETERASWNLSRTKIIEQAKGKARDQGTVIKNLQSEKAAVDEQLAAVNERLALVEAELETARNDKAALEFQVQNAQQQLSQQQAALQQPQTTGAGDASAQAQASDDMAVDDARVAQLEQEIASLRQELEATFALKAAAEEELESLRLQLASAIEERDQAALLAQAKQQEQQQALSNGSSDDAQPAREKGAALTDADRVALQQRIAAAEAKAAEAENKAAEAEKTIAQRSEKMKEALNKKLRESKELMAKELSEEKAKLTQEFSLRVEQEKKIWLAEQGSTTAPTQAAPADPSATSVPDSNQTGAAPADSSQDFSKLGDEAVRKLLTENATIKQIVATNIKKKLDVELKKAVEEAEQRTKADIEVKIGQAKEQATLMTEKKSVVRFNMVENKLKMAVGKLGVVETAAKETPQRPVVEVWEVAKQYRPPPVATAPIKTNTTTPGMPAPGTPTSSTPSVARPAAQAAPSTPVTRPAQAAGTVAGSLPPKPQGMGQTSLPQPAPNPFAQSTGASAPPAAPVNNPFAPQNAAAQPARTGLPVPARGGAAVQRGGRGGLQRGGPSMIGRGGGRGGANAQARNVSGPVGQMNPAATTFQPGGSAGNKRPRQESEVGAGAPPGSGKRMRGGAGAGAAAGGAGGANAGQ